MTGERYQLRGDVALSNDQRKALLRAFDELVYAARTFKATNRTRAARMMATSTRRMVAAFGEKRELENAK
jgi:hypothetical protein